MADYCSDIRDWLTLMSLPGVGCSLVHRLLEAFGSPAAVFSAGERVQEVQGVGPQLKAVFSDAFLLERARKWAKSELDRASARGIHLFSLADSRYPELLRTIHDPPVLLYLKGNPDLLQKTSVALVGSRAATSYGKRISCTLAAQLARAGIVVTSGLALGIDGSAHEGCLEAGGGTIAVLGCGVDVVYPQGHARLYDQVLSNGLIISEYPLGTRPDAFRFPARNRIISGLSRGIVVVEATCRSGSLITARLGLDQGREVFAVPGRVDSVKSEGTHELIRMGATLIQSAKDILEELQLATSSHCSGAEKDEEMSCSELSVNEEKILAYVDVYPVDIDELRVKTGFASGELHNHLLQLELKGIIRQLPGQQYERIT